MQKDTLDQFFDRIELLRWAGDNQQAIHELNLLVDIVDIVDNEEIAARAYNELAENYRWERDSINAIRAIKKVLVIYHNNSELKKIELLRNLFYTGKHFRTCQLIDSANYYHHKALELANKIHINNHALVGEVWMDMAYIQKYKIQDIQTALKYNINAQNIFLKTLDKWHVKIATVFYELASDFRILGDFERAANYARMAELIYKNLGDPFVGQKLNALIVQGNCYFYDEKFEKANHIYQEVLDIFKTVTPTRDALHTTISNNGVALYNLGKYEQAKRYVQQAIQLNPLENNSDSLDLDYAFINLALILQELNYFNKAKEYLNKSLAISLALFGEKHYEVFECYRYLGQLYENQAQPDKALFYYQKALISGFSDFNDTSILLNPTSFDEITKEASFRILFNKAKAFKEKYDLGKNIEDLKAAFGLYKTAYELIRETANSNMMEESLLNIPESFHEDLNYGVQCALTLYEITGEQEYLNQLLQFVETNKYFLLQNSIAKSNNRNTLGIPDSTYQKERKLLQKINSLKQEINNTEFRNDEEEYDMRLSLLNTTIEWENVRKRWKAYDNPTISFADLSSSMSTDDIKNNLLGDQDLLLEFFQTSDTIYTIAINKSQVNIFRLAKNPTLDKHLQEYISHLFYKENYSSKEDFINYVNAAQYLNKSILELALSKMDEDQTEKITRLIIVPDIQFSNVPFEAFISEPADTSYISYYGLHYLFKDFTFNYAYAINLLNKKTDENRNEKDGILAMSYSSPKEKNNLASRNDEFGELPYSAVELRNIRKWIGNGIFLDSEDATESVFKSRASNYDIIHLALHGIGDTLDMLNSHLVFKSSGNEIEDGMLYAHELYGMDLSSTELAVLSACETGVGKTMQGEGVYSLARGFAYAGCPSIVMSLWKVDDVSTSELMNYFYQNLSMGMQKDVALQQAKIKFLENTDDLGAHPANWAAFIALGNNDPVQIQSSVMKWYYWIILITVIGGSLISYRHFRSGHVKRA